MKICSTCKKTDAEVYFTPKSKGRCQQCNKNYMKEYRKNNSQELSDKKKIYYQENKQIILDKIKLYRKNNKEKIDIYKKKYRDKNKSARIVYDKIRYAKNRQCILNQQKQYYQKHRKERAIYNKMYRQKNKKSLLEKSKLYREKNRQSKSKKDRIYRIQNKQKIKLYFNNRLKTDILYKIKCNLRSALWDAIKRANTIRCSKTFELAGCNINFLKQYIEAQFTSGMSWERWSKLGLHIDHIRPIASFDLTDPYQQKQCFHFSNLQPLWAQENLEKGDTWDMVYQNWFWELKEFVYNI